MNYVVYFLASLLISLLLNRGIILLKARFNLSENYCRLGGGGIITAFFLGVVFNPELVITRPIVGLLLLAVLIAIFGIRDDFRNFSWKIQLVFQVLAVGILIFLGYEISQIATLHGGGTLQLNHWPIGNYFALSGAVVLAWFLFMINAINWSDGIDGLSGTISSLAGLTLFCLSLTSTVNQPAVAILAVIFLGAVLGFLLFNWPRALIRAGTSGSYFMGFFLAATAIMAGTKIATVIVVLAIPLVDLLWVIGERLREGRSIFKKDRNKRHLHYKLRALGWSDRKIVLHYLGFIVLVLAGYFLVEERWLRISILNLEIVWIVIFIFIITVKLGRRGS